MRILCSLCSERPALEWLHILHTNIGGPCRWVSPHPKDRGGGWSHAAECWVWKRTWGVILYGGQCEGLMLVSAECPSLCHSLFRVGTEGV